MLGEGAPTLESPKSPRGELFSSPQEIQDWLWKVTNASSENRDEHRRLSEMASDRIGHYWAGRLQSGNEIEVDIPTGNDAFKTVRQGISKALQILNGIGEVLMDAAEHGTAQPTFHLTLKVDPDFRHCHAEIVNSTNTTAEELREKLAGESGLQLLDRQPFEEGHSHLGLLMADGVLDMHIRNAADGQAVRFDMDFPKRLEEESLTT